MRTSKELTDLFFSNLKDYNSSNFKTIARADLSKQDAVVHKAFSSVITRYFIFREKHPEISDAEHRILYFKLKLDMVADYFSTYPDASTDNLIAFQLELNKYIKEQQEKRNRKSFVGGDVSEGETVNESDSSISDIQLESDNSVPVEQQSEPVSVAV